jgi:hypothetical protein
VVRGSTKRKSTPMKHSGIKALIDTVSFDSAAAYFSNIHLKFAVAPTVRSGSRRADLFVGAGGVSQDRVIIGKFPQEKFIFLTRGYPSPRELGRRGFSRSRNLPVSIVRHSGLIICKVEGFILKRSHAKSGCGWCTASGQENLRKGLTHLLTIH